MAKKVILTIDDEEHILDLLEYNLEKMDTKFCGLRPENRDWRFSKPCRWIWCCWIICCPAWTGLRC